MNRIDTRFTQLKQANRRGLIPFVTAGDPGDAVTVPVMHALVAAGADVIELGVPFSDPMADGPVIQRASERALARGVGLRRVLAMVAEFRQRDRDTPVVLMGYLNPLVIFGIERFAAAAAEAGVDGVLLVDFPPEESGDIDAALAAAGVARIHLAAPTTTDARLQRIADTARGFVYCVSFAGITGADRLTVASVGERVRLLRAMSNTPVAVGFGVKDAEQAKQLAADADAVVIGSALVERLAVASNAEAACTIVAEFLGPIRTALD